MARVGLLNRLGVTSVHIDIGVDVEVPGFFNLDLLDTMALDELVATPTLHIVANSVATLESCLGAHCIAVLHILPQTRSSDISQFLRMAMRANSRAGIAIDLRIPITTMDDWLADLDTVVVMGIPLGAATVPIDASTWHRLTYASEQVARRNNNCRVVVDGGVSESTFQQLCRLADEVVVGSLLFDAIDLEFQCVRLAEVARGA